jgi:hypothetical protein
MVSIEQEGGLLLSRIGLEAVGKEVPHVLSVNWTAILQQSRRSCGTVQGF